MCSRGAFGVVLHQGACSTRRSLRLVALMISSADAIRSVQGRIQTCPYCASSLYLQPGVACDSPAALSALCGEVPERKEAASKAETTMG